MQTSYPEICGILKRTKEGSFPTKSKTYINSEIISGYEVWIVIVTGTAQNRSQNSLSWRRDGRFHLGYRDVL